VAPEIHVGAELRGSSCRISVTDNGEGIDPEHVDRIFKMFQRLHSEDEHPGSGIGLAISKMIIERHGSDLTVTPAPGGGSTFAFSLPVVRRPAPVRAKVLQ
jgi:signal transduction histidine kinase